MMMMSNVFDVLVCACSVSVLYMRFVIVKMMMIIIIYITTFSLYLDEE